MLLLRTEYRLREAIRSSLRGLLFVVIVRSTLRKRDWFMDQETGFATATTRTAYELAGQDSSERRAASDRRNYSDRRRTGGLFEVRARRDALDYDRRQGERREQVRSWLRLWRREA